MRSVSISVRGAPIPQGSMVGRVATRKDGSRYAAIHYGNRDGLHQWRNAIGRAARLEWGEGVPAIGPVGITLEFVIQRPTSHYADLQGTIKARYERAEPTAPPDLDKLIRAVLDALTGIVYEDDSQVIDLHARKAFGSLPGLVIEVTDFA